MKVAFVIDIDYPHVGEIRPRKLARSLRQQGHEVLFIAANSGTRPPVEDVESGKVFRFGWFLRNSWYRHLRRAFPLNPFWVAWIWLVGWRESADVFVSSNVRLALPTLLAARLLGRPMILDLQENNPALVKSYKKTKWADRVLKNSSLVWVLEWMCVRFADHVWVVVEERIPTLPRGSARQDKISVVCHTPSTEEVRPLSTAKAESQHFTLAYVGLFAPGVGSVEIVLQALKKAVESDSKIQLKIAGGRQIEPEVIRLGLEAHVVFDGIIEPERLTEWLEQAHVGVIAYQVSEITNTTISNKLFHYMASGLAVLSTDMAPTRRVIEETGCGRIIPLLAGPAEVAEIILELKRDLGECVAMGNNGRAAIRAKYNWEADFARALDSLNRLAITKPHLAGMSASRIFRIFNH